MWAGGARAVAYIPPSGGPLAYRFHVAKGVCILTKADIVDTVAAEAELSKRQAGEIVDLILREIKAALQKGDRVALTPFGSFVVRSRKAREGRNPKTGATIKIPARKVPAFVAGKSLKEAVSGMRGSSKKSGAKKSGRKK
jgi:nucleoid DNA-binding protein